VPQLDSEGAQLVNSPQEVSQELGASGGGAGNVPASVVACSDLGRKRPDNEDSFLIFDLATHAVHPEDIEIALELASPGLLVGVADGMGGHQSGQVASQLCIEALTAEFFRGLHLAEVDPHIDWQKMLVEAVEVANQYVSQAARENPAHHGMGTTLTAGLLTERDATIVQVGDSRAYLYRQGVLTQLTRDQTIANSLQALHKEMKTDTRFGEMLVQAVGAVEKVDVQVSKAGLEPGDCVLICCDGLYKSVRHGDIAEVLGSASPLISRGKELIARANSAGGPDNITVVLAELQTQPASSNKQDG
jgi:serine/threonine protein phosphatase PrpC